MIVNWEFYLKRKRTTAEKWLTKKKIMSYDDLVKVTKKLGIETPSEKKVSEFFKKPEVKEEKNVQKTKRRTRKIKNVRKTTTSVPGDKIQSINENPKEQKQQKPKRKRTYRKRKNTKKEGE